MRASRTATSPAFSFHELGQALPDYYLPERLADTQRFGTALLANLGSPSRGLFVFSPFLLVAIVLFVRQRVWSPVCPSERLS